MIRIFYKNGNAVLKDTNIRHLSTLDNIIWVDMQSPLPEEEEFIETTSGISIQTPQEIAEIESSSRYFERNNEITANSNFLKLENGAKSISSRKLLMTSIFPQPSAFASTFTRLSFVPSNNSKK